MFVQEVALAGTAAERAFYTGDYRILPPEEVQIKVMDDDHPALMAQGGGEIVGRKKAKPGGHREKYWFVKG